MKGRLNLKQYVVVVGTTDQEILPVNPHRHAAQFNVAAGPDTPYVTTGTVTPAVATATTGIKSSFTVPAGVQAYLDSGSMFNTAGTGVIASLQIVRGANTLTVQSVTTAGVVSAAVPLQAGDTVQWNVTTAVAASTCDFTINVRQERVPNRVSLNFEGPSTLGQGVEVVQGNLPVLATYLDFG